MNLAKHTVLAFNGERGLAEDYLGNVVRFTINDVVHTDRGMVRTGSVVLITTDDDSITIELPSSSFNRWEERTHNEYVYTHTCTTIDNE